MMICDHVEFDCAVDPQHIHTPLHPTHPITTIKPQQPTLPPLTSSTTTSTKLFGGAPPPSPTHPPFLFFKGDIQLIRKYPHTQNLCFECLSCCLLLCVVHAFLNRLCVFSCHCLFFMCFPTHVFMIVFTCFFEISIFMFCVLLIVLYICVCSCF